MRPRFNLKKPETNNKNHYSHSYVDLLRRFQRACESTPEDSEILTLNKRMENSTFPFLLALQWKQRDGKEIGLEMVSTGVCNRPHTEDIVMTQKLLEPKNIVVIDGSSLHDVFGDIVYYAPQDDLVESKLHHTYLATIDVL